MVNLPVVGPSGTAASEQPSTASFGTGSKFIEDDALGPRKDSRGSGGDDADPKKDPRRQSKLDGFWLLAVGGVQNPSYITKANCSSMGINEIAHEDLQFFDRLQVLDLSDNNLSDERVLTHLCQLPQVTSIILSCNKLQNIQDPVVYSKNPSNVFPNLRHLNLSFNELRCEVLDPLSRLYMLVSLDLSNNCITSILKDRPREYIFIFNKNLKTSSSNTISLLF